MNQQWLSVIGLTLDITGAFIVIREWWLGHTQTLRESAQNQSVKVLLEAIADQNREKPYTVSQALEQIANTGIEIDIIVKIRPLLIKTGATLILLGFAAQLIGAWPGGVPSIGIK